MVKSQNGAGLWSDSSSSDGAVFHLQPIADFSANTQQICTGGLVQYTNLSANITGQTWYFTGGSPATSTMANPTVTYASAGTYAVKLVVTGVSGADSVIRSSYINVQATPSAPSIVSNPVICQGSANQLEVSGSVTLTWYSTISGGTALGTGSTLDIAALEGSTSYYVRSEIGTCISPMTTINVMVEPMPATPQPSTPTPICSGTATQITVTGTATIKWYSDNLANNLVYTGASITTQPLIETTTYYVRTETAHCITPMNSVTVEVKPNPAIPIVNDQQSLCNGQSIQLYAQGDPLIKWYGSQTASTALSTGENYQTLPITANDTFFVRSEVNGCFSDFAQIVVTVFDLPAQPTINLVSGELCGSVGDSYQWFLNGVALDSAVNQCYTPLQDGNYTIQVVNTNGCVSPLSAPYNYSTINIADQSRDQQYSIFPNPTKNSISITFSENPKTQNIILFDALGQEVYEQKFRASQRSIIIDLSVYSKGLYYLVIESDDSRSVTKVVKE
jgi:PKD repeat protein